VAYRRFFTLACFVCGLTAAGCGGGGATASRSNTTTDDTPTDDTNPPVNGDQAPISKDQPPLSTDQAASASPGSSPSGGVAIAACQAFCATVSGAEGCPGNNPSNAAVRAVCGRGCMLDEQQAACQTEAVAAFNCIVALAGLCTADGPTEADAAACEQSRRALDSCEDAHKPPEMQADPCSIAGGCQCGDDDCKTCQCVLGGQSQTCVSLCN
jgi:hypothetical protein